MATQEQPNLIAKLLKVMSAIDHVEKRGRNEKQNYAYVKATDLAHAVRGELVAAGVLMTASVRSEERWQQPTQSGGVMNYCNLSVEFTFRDATSAEQISFIGKGWGQDTGDKAPYKAITGALKYALRTSFLIPDESDPENEKGKPDESPANPPARANGAATPAKPAAAQPPSPTGQTLTITPDDVKVTEGQYGPIADIKANGKGWKFFGNNHNADQIEQLLGWQPGTTYTFTTEQKGKYLNLKALLSVKNANEGSGIQDADIPF